MHCQLAEAQEAQGLEQVTVYSAVDYPLQVDRLRQNFHPSHRMLPQAALRDIARLHVRIATRFLPSPNNVNR